MDDALTENDVHIRYCYCDDALMADHQADYLALLTDDETTRYERFAFEKDRRLFLVARTLLRTTLSQFADVHPADWRFEQTAKGKLFLPGNDGSSQLTFNVSHSGQVAVCAVTRRHRIGVDVESTVRRTDQKVARYFMSPSEMAAFEEAEGAAKRDLFYRYWTLKEAYAKALGMGLSMRFTEFSFWLSSDAQPALVVDQTAPDADRDWQFHQLPVAPHYFLATAVECHRVPLTFDICCEPPDLAHR